MIQLSPPYLRQQADRCQRLSRSCMDLKTARDLRLMAEEYFAETVELEANTEKGGNACGFGTLSQGNWLRTLCATPGVVKSPLDRKV